VAAGAWVAGTGVAAEPQADKTRLVSTSTVNRANRFFFMVSFLLSAKGLCFRSYQESGARSQYHLLSPMTKDETAVSGQRSFVLRHWSFVHSPLAHISTR
jgi:hypothetical protein